MTIMWASCQSYECFSRYRSKPGCYQAWLALWKHAQCGSSGALPHLVLERYVLEWPSLNSCRQSKLQRGASGNARSKYYRFESLRPELFHGLGLQDGFDYSPGAWSLQARKWFVGTPCNKVWRVQSCNERRWKKGLHLAISLLALSPISIFSFSFILYKR